MRWWAEVPLSWRCATMIPQRLSVRWSQPLLRHNSMPAHSPCSICLPRCIALHCHAMLWSRDNIVISYGRKGWMPTWNSCKRMSMLWLSKESMCLNLAWPFFILHMSSSESTCVHTRGEYLYGWSKAREIPATVLLCPAKFALFFFLFWIIWNWGCSLYIIICCHEIDGSSS
jgi:hypothetical protein